ncbi:MAG: CBS domain-containing protein [Natronomonas sp.]
MNWDEIPVEDVMSTPVRTVEGELAVVEAARILCDERIGSVVVQGNEEDGILTDTDIVRAVKNGRDPEKTVVTELVSSPVLTTEPDSTLQEAAERMNNHAVKKLPVVEDGHYVGIVTATDLIGRVSPELDDVVEMFVTD